MQRKQYSSEFKAKVALEAIKGLKTINEIASETGVHPTQIARREKAGARRVTTTILQSQKPRGETTGGIDSNAIPANWTTQGGVGLDEKKSWNCPWRLNGS
jgi:hypothetical protein